jgi:hypothetical protein
MRIDFDGNVGINKTAPGYKLHVGGNSYFEGEMMWKNANITSHAHHGTNEDWYIRSGQSGGKVILQDTGGRVGVGHASPVCRLDVSGAIHLAGENIGGIGVDTISDASNRTNTYIAFGPAGADNDWAYLRQIGVSNGYDLALDFHDDGNDAGFVIRDIQSTANPDTITTRFKVERGGNVGIGLNNPQALLHVAEGFVVTPDVYPSNTVFQSLSGTSSTIYTQTVPRLENNTSIFADGNIMTKEAIVATGRPLSGSDRRMKTNIEDTEDEECLQVLRQLKPKKYTYKDFIHKGTEPVWGFIADEVREILPNATQLLKNTIPNIYELANVTSSNVITFTDFNTSNLEANASTIEVRTIKNKIERVKIAEVIDGHSIRVEEDVSEWTGSVDETGNVVAGNQLFVYGQEVDDFIYITKDAIWTVATSALQEVDRQLQAEKTRNDELEARILALENTT